MYRQMLQQSPLPSIYCSREEFCDLNCGKFHLSFINRKTKRHNLTPLSIKMLTDEKIYKNSELIQNGSLIPIIPQPTTIISPAISQTTSARRKISDEYKEIRLPSPEFVEDDNTLWDKKAAKKQLLFQGSSLDTPMLENTGIQTQNRNLYDDQDSEIEIMTIQERPPNFIVDEEAEDFEDIIDASKPPEDAFSNPILLRDSDPLTTHKKRRHYRFPQQRQQSLNRLGGGGGGGNGLPISQSSTPSGQRTEFEDTADNSSIDLSLAEISNVINQGKSQVESSSPSNILRFIEEQKQRAYENANNVANINNETAEL
ncbi:hypothetical protein Mgra_00005812 [Meloidogyne graminicola]|uniref:Uncharacterized protein n=1 Tax=Meloidogyne graminicola TaxID=189291 RepID=A0A8S9ZMX5_9BILA|nr:hypothetical protein Mgra_00005812 [Meloidogyne graminicola]